MRELDEQLRTLIDTAATPVRLEEIEARVSPATPVEDGPAFRRFYLAGILCVAALVLAAGYTILGSPSHHTRLTIPASVPTTRLGALAPLPRGKLLSPQQCTAFAPKAVGCSVDQIQVATDAPRAEDANGDEGPVDQSVVKISAAQAAAAATNAVPGTVQTVDLENEEGRTFYEVEIMTSSGTIKDVQINATDGTVLSQSPESADDGD
jgi:hypothetical protein